MRFANPFFLVLVAVVPLAGIFWTFLRARREKSLEKLVAPSLRTRLLPPGANLWGLQAVCILSGLFLALLSAARPQWGKTTERFVERSRNVVVAVDVSRSMLAEDVRPNRLDRTKADVADLIDSLEGDRCALVAFRRTGVVVCPLTTDRGFLRSALEQLSPESAPRGETDLGSAIRASLDALDPAADDHNAVILISDGGDLRGQALENAELARKRGIPIFTVGIGDPRVGATIPSEDGRGLQKFKGEPVKVKLEEAALKAIAAASKGRYVPLATAGTAETTLGAIYRRFLRQVAAKEQNEEAERAADRYQFFLVPGLVLLLLGAFLSKGRFGKPNALAVAAVLAVVSTAGARTRESFNDGWEFAPEGGAFAPVRVPHDWAIAGPFDPAGDGDTGKLPWKGAGVYRKTMVLSEKPAGRVFLDFDGAMAHARVSVNGQACGRNAYAYLGFRVDLTPYLFAGTNVVEVKCETKNFHSRWYPGGGLYRNTWLVRTDTVYIQDDSLRIETKDVLTGEAKLKVSGDLVSRRPKDVRVRVAAVLKDRAGRVVAAADKTEEVDGYGTEDFSLKLKVRDPQLWEMEDGAALYTLEVTASGEGFSDALARRIGLREATFDAKRGFFLNGRRVQLKGVDLHSDLGPLGMAFDADAMRRQLAIMRDMGANALRTSHNCPAPEVLDLCDEMGFFVWDECFDKWNITAGRTAEDPLEAFVPPILAAWVRRDRLHPCVFCWSIGNEITPGDATPPGQENWWTAANDGTSAERCARFRHVVRGEDETRPVCIGSCFPSAGLRGDYAALELSGWNYRGMYEEIHRKYPHQPMVYSESASALSEFGYYADALPTNKTDFAARKRHVDSYDFNAVAWGDIPDREFFRMERDTYCAGEFVWMGIDYLGEPTPYNKWGDITRQDPKACSRSSYFGICDLCALPKDRFYLYRSHWNPEAFTLHIVPGHWNFPEKAGRKMPVFVYTSADEAELFVNGVSQGRRRKDRTAGTLDDYYSVLPRYRLMWNEVPYAAGEVKAVAYGRDGGVLGEQVLRTAGAPAKVVLTPERVYGSLCVVRVTLADRDGTFVPNENRRISFAAEGGEILAVGNSDPRGLDSFKDVSSHPLCFGRAAVYLRLGDGAATLKASADGLVPAEIHVE